MVILNNLEWVSISKPYKQYQWFWEMEEDMEDVLQPFMLRLYDIITRDQYTLQVETEWHFLKQDIMEYIEINYYDDHFNYIKDVV